MPTNFRYDANISEFTVFCRTDEEEPLAVVKVSTEDSWKLMNAINRLCDMQREFGYDAAKRDVCAALGVDLF